MENIRRDGQRLGIIVDVETGALRAIEHRTAGLSLIVDPDRAAAHPFMVILADGTVLRTWLTCTVQEGSDGAIHICWTLDHGLLLRVKLLLDAAGDLRCMVELRNPERLPVVAAAYPYI